ncbi:hypothetical protein ABZ372_06670 [Streptomyces sp. NPDC005921]
MDNESGHWHGMISQAPGGPNIPTTGPRSDPGLINCNHGDEIERWGHFSPLLHLAPRHHHESIFVNQQYVQIREIFM